MSKFHYLLYIGIGIASFLIGILIKLSRVFWINQGEILIPLAAWPFLFCTLVYALTKSQKNLAYSFLISSTTSLIIYTSFLSPFLVFLLMLVIPFILAGLGYAVKRLRPIFFSASISYAALILSFLLFFAWGAYSVYNSGYYAVYIEKHKAAYEEWVEISDEELKEHPELGKLIERCNVTPCKFQVSWGEWEKIRDFIEKKRYKFLFSLNGINVSAINKSAIRKIFKERGYPLSEDLWIGKGPEGWWIADRANDRRFYLKEDNNGLEAYIYCDLFKIKKEYYKFRFPYLRGD